MLHTSKPRWLHLGLHVVEASGLVEVRRLRVERRSVLAVQCLKHL